MSSAHWVVSNYTVSTKSKPKVFFAITLKIVQKFPSNLARSWSNYYRTVCVKAIHFTCHVYTHTTTYRYERQKCAKCCNYFRLYPRVFGNNNVKSHYLLPKFDTYKFTR